jgi:hypothetical protein
MRAEDLQGIMFVLSVVGYAIVFLVPPFVKLVQWALS